MKQRIGLLSAFAVLAALVFTFGTAAATSNALCTSDPVSGPPGTDFFIQCTGFSPNTHVNAYVVEPDGRAINAGQIIGFDSNVAGGSILTDADGAASFWWHSQDGSEELPGGGAFAHQLGDWTWVVHELGLAQTVVAQGQATVNIEAYHWEQVGATLAGSSTDKQNFSFTGAGFWRDEYVNIWVSLPPNCSGRSNVEGASADDPFYQGLFDGFYGPSTVKADEQGHISFPILFFSEACRGFYKVTAYAPGSGYGAITEIEVGGKAIVTSSGILLDAVPDSIDALNPIFTLLGDSWDANAQINCWSTRPDGRSFGLGTVQADASGHFAWDVQISGSDSFAPYASEEPGVWSVTCRVPASGDSAITQVTVHALTSDP